MAPFSESDLSKNNCMLKDSMAVVSDQRSTNRAGLGTYLLSSRIVLEKGLCT